MHGLLDACHGATEVDLACLVVQIVHGGVRIIVCAEHHFGFAGFVRLPAVCDCHCGEDDALLVTQGDILAKFELGCEVLIHIQCDRHGPERSAFKAHVLNDAIIVCLA